MSILVTGGAGFIGSAMVKHLLNEGFEVKAFDLPMQFIRNPLPDKAIVCEGSIMDINDLSCAIKDCDYIIHFAARLGVKKTEEHQLTTLYTNIQGTINVLEACIKDQVDKVLFASSSEVYGDQTKISISENNPLNPKSVYALSKLAGEYFIKAYYQRYEVDYTIIRFFNIYGNGQRNDFVIPRFVENIKQNKPPQIYGTGEQVRAFCHVDDAIKGSYLALLNKNANSEIFNIGNDTEPVSMEELAFRVINLAKKDFDPLYIPIEVSDRTSSREIYTRVPNISKAKKILGYKPSISLNEGILKMLE